jgi:hypothetical protein
MLPTDRPDRPGACCCNAVGGRQAPWERQHQHHVHSWSWITGISIASDRIADFSHGRGSRYQHISGWRLNLGLLRGGRTFWGVATATTACRAVLVLHHHLPTYTIPYQYTPQTRDSPTTFPSPLTFSRQES